MGVLTIFFHGRQIEQDLIKRVRTVDIDGRQNAPRTHALSEIHDPPPAYFAPKAASASRAQIEKSPFAA